jgi:hypothetical protein
MSFKCQSCDFPVYNRLFPKCEKCGVDLAPGVAHSPERRRELLREYQAASDKAASERAATREETRRSTEASGIDLL